MITFGDNCRHPDSPLAYDQILGLVTKLERGKISMNLDSSGSRLFGRVWMGRLPFRCLYYKLRAQAGRIYRRMKGR